MASYHRQKGGVPNGHYKPTVDRTRPDPGQAWLARTAPRLHQPGVRATSPGGGLVQELDADQGLAVKRERRFWEMANAQAVAVRLVVIVKAQSPDQAKNIMALATED